MTKARFLLAIVALVFVSACTIESDTVLPDPTAAGDVIAGLPTDGPFKLESFEPSKNAYKAFVTLTPERDGAAMRYNVSFDDGTPNRLLVQARKMSEGNYLLRFSQIMPGMRPSLDESGLAFLSEADGEFYLMSSVTDDGWLEEIFPGGPLPKGTGSSTVRLVSLAQAQKMSDWFAKNRNRLAENRDYSKFRLAR